tara:strand:- start:110 stop:388 length:279 start_codon:yes stop_codon:yes gene_type:complete
MENWKQVQNEYALIHNKRVKSIREARLPKSCVTAIDEAISAMSSVRKTLVEGIVQGFNGLSLEEVIELSRTLEGLNREFNYREVITKPKEDK